MRMTLLTIVWACLIANAATAPAQEWTRFRGPNGSGVNDAVAAPARWTEDDYRWKIALPGEGHSSPVLWGKKLFITSAEGDSGQRYLHCIDTRDGSSIWQRQFSFEKYKKHRNNSFATATPAVDAQRVYVLWQSLTGSYLTALDHQGKTVWKIDMGRYKSGHGTGRSPIVYRDMVIVGNDNEAESFLLAVDSASGAERWRVERIGDRACYSTPCVFETPGRRPEIIFTHSYRGITGVDADTGQKRWEIDVFGTHKQRAVASPIVYRDLVIGSSGFVTAEKNVVAVRPVDTPGGSTVKEIYRLNRQVPHVPTPLIYRDWMFLWTDTGIVTCVEAADGKQLWQKRIGGTFFGSPVCVGGRLYAVDADGVVVVLAASDQFEELGRVELGGRSWSTPAAADGQMYFRTLTHLYCLGGE